MIKLLKNKDISRKFPVSGFPVYKKIPVFRFSGFPLGEPESRKCNPEGSRFMAIIPPSVTIGVNYLERWHLIPRNRFLNVYLHKFSGSDDDRALHDHPWHSVSFLLKGRLDEISEPADQLEVQHIREVPLFRPVFRRATFAHRLKLIDGPAWTIFITGPRIRDWGFICPQGWRHWRDFTDQSGHKVGRGCT